MLRQVLKEVAYRDWPREMCPGHCFLWKTPNGTTLFSIVQKAPLGEEEEGFRWALTYGGLHPNGEFGWVREDRAAWLLSQEQMTLARQLRWPQNERIIERILLLPPT